MFYKDFQKRQLKLFSSIILPVFIAIDIVEPLPPPTSGTNIVTVTQDRCISVAGGIQAIYIWSTQGAHIVHSRQVSPYVIPTLISCKKIYQSYLKGFISFRCYLEV